MRARYTIGPDELVIGDHFEEIPLHRGKFKVITPEQRQQIDRPVRVAEYGVEFDDGTENDPLDPPAAA